MTAATLLVVAAVLMGIFVLGPPSEIRLARLDRQRLSDLQSLESAIENYRRSHDRVPASLEQISQAGWHRLHFMDPDSGQPYEYVAKDRSSYELCANFARAGGDAHYSDLEDSPFWRHPAGRHCFALEAKAPALQ